MRRRRTCEGALQESPPLISPIRAAAVGLLELMSTGPLISMEWRWGGGASMGLWDMVSEVKECRFLLFFFSPARWAPLLWGPEEAPSPESPLESDGLSNSISCRAAELNCGRGLVGGQRGGQAGAGGIREIMETVTLHNKRVMEALSSGGTEFTVQLKFGV